MAANKTNMVKRFIFKSEIIRKRIFEIVNSAKGGHLGGDLSCVNLLVALYFSQLNVDPQNPEMEDRDRFIMSKGHSIEALYAVLESAGFISKELLATYGKYNSPFAGHPVNKIPGIEFNTGSLGHGLSVGVGIALSAKRDGKPFRTYVLMGDGELAEGSVYEAAMAGSHYKLDNLVAFIDRNGLQISGSTEEVMQLEPIDKRWEAFGWEVYTINGDNMAEIMDVLERIDWNGRKPHLIIMRTTKGNGVSFMENKPVWHHGVPSDEEFQRAFNEIDERINANNIKSIEVE